MKSLKPVLGLEDAFGERAKSLRALQFSLFEIYNQAGFSEVIPPMVERPQSLSSGAGKFLADQTIIFSDPADAGQLAIRPDMTPQVARIAATRMQSMDTLKLYYSGPVMLARPDVRTGSRQQWQTGVECLGLAGIEGDVEMIHLAARSMAKAGFQKPVLQIGHMGIIHALISESNTDLEVWAQLISRYSPEDLASHLATENLSDTITSVLMDLAMGLADEAWLSAQLGKVNDDFDKAAKNLLDLVHTATSTLSDNVEMVIDASVTPRFLYHSGMVFAGFSSNSSRALLHGGRYDEMMKSHGRDMPATGFSFDLWQWIK